MWQDLATELHPDTRKLGNVLQLCVKEEKTAFMSIQPVSARAISTSVDLFLVMIMKGMGEQVV